MHEWALAEAVVSTAEKVAKQRGLAEISEIQIKLGQLQQIEQDILEFAIKEIIQSQNPALKETKVRFQDEKALFKCRICDHKWTFGKTLKKLDSADSEAIHFVPEVVHAYMRCPECKSPDFEIVQGRGVWVESISGK